MKNNTRATPTFPSSNSKDTKPLLLLLTHQFPFNKGEEFIETEINYLVKNFRIEIVPFGTLRHCTKQRSIPPEVVVRKDLAKKLSRSWFKIIPWVLIRPQGVLLFLKMALLEWPQKFSIFTEQYLFLFRSIYLYLVLHKSYTAKSINVIYSYWMTTSALAAVLLKKDHPKSIAASRTHGFDLYHFRNPGRSQPYQKTIIKNLDYIFPISQHGADYLKKLYRGSSQKIIVQRLGVKTAAKRNTPPVDGQLHIVSCAYLSPVKRIHLLIDALFTCHLPVTWTHLGGGEIEPEIRKKASNMPSNIKWHITGHITNQDILSFYRSTPVDLFINTSESEGLPVSIMEAMSYGIPVAATNVGGTSELVVHNKNGILWPENVSFIEIAHSLFTFFQLSGEQKQTMRNNAWQTWHDNTNADIQYSAFILTLQNLIDHEYRKG